MRQTTMIDRRLPHVARGRRGVTLTEVLIAMFVLAIGMMGILALFPLGAAQMAQAVKDERTAQLAAICEGHMRIFWRNACIKGDGSLVDDTTLFTYNPPNILGDPALMALDNPNVPLGTPPATFVSTDPTYLSNSKASKMSSPLFIDPIGFATQAVQDRQWVGGQLLQGILPRRSLQTITSLPSAQQQTAASIRLCALMDDLTFNSQGIATPVTRAGRYNAAFLLQRAKNNVRHEVNVKIIVYQGRPPADTPGAETYLGQTFVQPSSDNFIVASAGVPPLRKGTWILLMNREFTNPVPGSFNADAFADFYRVVGFEASGGFATISVSPPLREHSRGALGYPAQAVVLDNVAEVFDRGTISPFEAPAP